MRSSPGAGAVSYRFPSRTVCSNLFRPWTQHTYEPESRSLVPRSLLSRLFVRLASSIPSLGDLRASPVRHSKNFAVVFVVGRLLLVHLALRHS